MIKLELSNQTHRLARSPSARICSWFRLLWFGGHRRRAKAPAAILVRLLPFEFEWLGRSWIPFFCHQRHQAMRECSEGRPAMKFPLKLHLAWSTRQPARGSCTRAPSLMRQRRGSVRFQLKSVEGTSLLPLCAVPILGRSSRVETCIWQIPRSRMLAVRIVVRSRSFWPCSFQDGRFECVRRHRDKPSCLRKAEIDKKIISDNSGELMC